MKLSVIGAGYVGLTTAACLAQVGHEVFCSESDAEKLSKLQNGVMPLFEPHLEDVIEGGPKAWPLALRIHRRGNSSGEMRSSFAWERRHCRTATPICRPSKESRERLQSARRDIGWSSRRALCRSRPARSCANTSVGAQHERVEV
jgi:hypothetical protein